MIRGLPTWSKRAYARAWTVRRDLPGDLLYVALGDSAAQGLGATLPERGYVGLLAETIAATSGRSVRTVNLGVSGARIADVIHTQLPELASLRPDVVTVGVGGNDVRRFDERRFAAQVTALLDGLPAHAVVADVPCFWSGAAEDRARTAARIVRDAASARDFPVAELHRVTEARRDRSPRRDFAIDMFHPNDSGYTVWASAFAPAVTARATTLGHRPPPR